MSFRLSYIISTRNRLPFLKVTLGVLIGELEMGEEIVVVDGNSTDGTKEYLQQLFIEGKIHQFISEPDLNQAHGWNKAILMARGSIIKKIIDDDVFCYPSIRKCAEYMIKNSNVDVVISNDLSVSLKHFTRLEYHSRKSQFITWKTGKIPSFTFGDVHMLIRRNSLSLIGLYSTSFTMMDWFYSLQISYAKANIVFYTGYNALSVNHEGSISSNINTKLTTEQGRRGGLFFEYKGDTSDMSSLSRLKITIGKLIGYKKSVNESVGSTGNIDITIEDIYFQLYDRINKINAESMDFEFIQ